MARSTRKTDLPERASGSCAPTTYNFRSRALLATCVLQLALGAGTLRAQEGNFNYQNGFDDGAGIYAGAVDTNIAEPDPASNSNDDPYLWVDGGDVPQQVLIRFDDIVGVGAGQIQPGTYIAGAELVLVTSDVEFAGSAQNHPLHTLLQAWDATTITWNSPVPFGGDGIQADDGEASSTVLDATSAVGATAAIHLDVTSAVESWVAGAPNHGVVLLAGGNDGLAIRTSEDPIVANRPLLEVSACGGDAFADAYQNYFPGTPGPSGASTNPAKALGIPDYAPGCTELGPDCDSVSLGVGGTITLRFLDNALTGSGSGNQAPLGDGENDLWIFEVGPDVEHTSIELSRDGLIWEDVGQAPGNTTAIDIDAFGFGTADSFTFVRLTDVPGQGNTGAAWDVGADIDAICALSSVSVSAVPSLRPLGIASLVLLILLVITRASVWRKTTRAEA